MTLNSLTHRNFIECVEIIHSAQNYQLPPSLKNIIHSKPVQVPCQAKDVTRPSQCTSEMRLLSGCATRVLIFVEMTAVLMQFLVLYFIIVLQPSNSLQNVFTCLYPYHNSHNLKFGNSCNPSHCTNIFFTVTGFKS